MLDVKENVLSFIGVLSWLICVAKQVPSPFFLTTPRASLLKLSMRWMTTSHRGGQCFHQEMLPC